MSTINNTNYNCTVCDKSIVPNSHEHDHCVLVNNGYDLICQYCPFVCKTKCDNCVICEEAQIDPSESESEDEPEGECCAGATDPRIVITYTMAGGGAHWENWEVHYDIADGQQKELYINNITGHNHEYGMKLFYHEDHPDQLRIEAKDFEQEDWQEMVHYN